MTPRLHRIATLVVLATQLGCQDREVRPIVPCVSRGFVTSIGQDAVTKVDILFMIDNSNSMLEEQTTLAANFPRMVQALVTGDRKLNNPSSGTPTPEQQADDFEPVRDLHIAVVTSDLGVGGASVTTCGDDTGTSINEAMFGEDGIMRSSGGCGAGGASNFLAFDPDHATPQDIADFTSDFACVSNVGTGGCGIEQQLEAPLKALTPGSSDIRFFNNTTGHGLDLNAGFLREDAVLAVILVTDEEDCSLQDPTLFNPGALPDGDPRRTAIQAAPLNVRCPAFANTDQYPYLYPVQRYVEGLRKLKPLHEDRIVFAAITGIPVELVPAVDATPDYTAMLNDDRLAYHICTAQDAMVAGSKCARLGAGNALIPSCVAPDRDNMNGADGEADPPRRIIEVARAFGKNATLQSICDDDFNDALKAIVDKIANALDNVCIPRALNPDSNGLVDCYVVEELAAPGSTDALAGTPTRCTDVRGCEGGDSISCPVELTPLSVKDGREICRVKQVPVTRTYDDDGNVAGSFDDTAAGWYYDDFTTAVRERCRATQKPQRIAFTSQGVPANGVTVSMECLQRVQSPSSSSSSLNKQRCESSGQCPSGYDCDLTTLVEGKGLCEPVDVGSFCDPALNTNASGSVPSNAHCARGSVPVHGSAQPLFCEPQSRTCQLDCQADVDCPTSFVCDTSGQSDAIPYGICVNPICI